MDFFSKNTEIDFEDLIELPNLGVLIVDMQEKYIFEIGNDSESEKIAFNLIEWQKLVLNILIDKNIPICSVQMKEEKSNLNLDLFNLLKNYKFSKFFLKERNDIFSSSDLLLFKKEFRIENLIIMGINKSLCVRDIISFSIKNFNIYTSDRLVVDSINLRKSNQSKINTFYKSNTRNILFSMKYINYINLISNEYFEE